MNKKHLLLILTFIIITSSIAIYSFSRNGNALSVPTLEHRNEGVGTLYSFSRNGTENGDGRINSNVPKQEFGNEGGSGSPQSGGWILQTMPNMGARKVRDFMFVDSLTGFAVASPDSYTDSAHILKTTNGGSSWSIKFTYPGQLHKIKLLNQNTGFAGGDYILKTTNAGENWAVWNWPLNRIIDDMFIFSEDTIWYGDIEPTAGGLYRTTNGGLYWEKRDNGIPANSYPFFIYFYNNRIGFASGNTNVYKTTDAGLSWNLTFTGGISKLQFKDSLNCIRASQGFFRTIDGGINWTQDSLPRILGNTYTNKWINNFTIINNDTMYCSGGYVYFYSNGSYKSTIYKTTNGGINWGYQIVLSPL